MKEYTISFKLDASAETKAAVLPPPGEDLSPDKSSINFDMVISLNSIFHAPYFKTSLYTEIILFTITLGLNLFKQSILISSSS